MAEFLKLKLSGKNFTFATRRQLREWWAEEKSHWEWIWDGGAPNSFSNLASLGRSIDSQMAAETPSETLASNLDQFFQSARPSVRYSGSVEGRRYLSAYKHAGITAAAAVIEVEQVFDFNANRLARQPDLTARYAQGVAASYAELDIDKAAMINERRNYRHAVDRLHERVRELETEKDRFVEVRRRGIRRWTRMLKNRLRASWTAEAEALGSSRDAAIAEIRATEEKYRVQMALKAPVEYWRGKATTHSRWEIGWGVAMVAYFALAAFAIYAIAEKAADYLKTVPDAAHATPIYIIVSGATVGATTLIFWLGRLITKLFLSEHHLATDCREKAVMTQAFLSMETRENFSAEERAIILASIFRSSPDGIVKDEGPADFGVHSLLSRQFSR